MIGFLTWAVGSKVGRWGLLGAFAFIAGWLAFQRVTALGAAKLRAKQAQAAIKTLQQELRADREITNMGPSARKLYVSKWVRDAATSAKLVRN